MLQRIRQPQDLTLIITIILILGLLPISSRSADDDCVNGKDGDRCTKYEESRKKSQEETKKLLTPQQMMHEQLRDEHLRKAEDARARQDFGTASNEEQKAMMEQVKAQQLQEQIQKNSEVGEENKTNRDLVKKGDQPEKQKTYDPTVITVREKPKPSPSPETVTETERKASSQVANLADVSSPLSMGPEPTSATTLNFTLSIQSPTVDNQHLLNQLEKDKGPQTLSLSHDESAGRKDGQFSSVPNPQARLLSSVEDGPGGTSSNSPASTGQFSPSTTANQDAPVTRSAGNEAQGRGISSDPLPPVSNFAGKMVRTTKTTPILDDDFLKDCVVEITKADSKDQDKLPPRCLALIKRCQKEMEETMAQNADKVALNDGKNRVRTVELSEECQTLKDGQEATAKPDEKSSKVREKPKGMKTKPINQSLLSRTTKR